MRNQRNNMSLCLTGYQLFTEVVHSTAIKYKFKLIVSGKVTSYTREIFDEFKKCSQQNIEFIESINEEMAMCQALEAARDDVLVLLLISSQGLSKISAGLNSAILNEIPLFIVNVQHYFALSDTTQQVIQTDLEKICYTSHDGISLPIMAFNTVENPIQTISLAIEIAFKFMTPIVFMVDTPILLKTYVVSTSQFKFMRLKKDIFYTFYRNWFSSDSKKHKNHIGEYHYRIGKDRLAQELSYYRNKVNEIAKLVQLYFLRGNVSAKYGLISWGSTDKIVNVILEDLLEDHLPFCHIHLKLIYPIPDRVIKIVQSMERLFVLELNTGQLARLLKTQISTPVESIGQINGEIFNREELVSFIKKKV